MKVVFLKILCLTLLGVILFGTPVRSQEDDDTMPPEERVCIPGDHRCDATSSDVPHTFGLNDCPANDFRNIASFSSYGNNREHPPLGTAGGLLGRATPNAYTDGKSNPPRLDVSARDISNAINQFRGPEPEPPKDEFLNDLFWLFGQFIDHDLDLTEPGTEELPIQLDPSEGGPNATLGFHRSSFVEDTRGVRQQPDLLSGFIDASNIYGSNEARAKELREFSGGRLKTSVAANGEAVLPDNSAGLPNEGGPAPVHLEPRDQFLAGDRRSNEHALLSAMHTLWVREHNYWANTIANERVDPIVPLDSDELERDEAIYQLARRIVTGELQAILYQEWLPLLLGPRFRTGFRFRYRGYNPSVNPQVTTEFSTVAFRIGHTMVSDQLVTDPVSGATVSLFDLFFNPDFVRENGADNLLLGARTQNMQRIDRFVVEDLRTRLFRPGSPVPIADLPAFNIQRGRDHGVADYNTLRVAFGLEPKTLEELGEEFNVYPDISAVDPWPAGLAEAPEQRGENGAERGRVGELFSAILVDQFSRSRTGDRFYYENNECLESLRDLIHGTRMATILQRNTRTDEEIENAFVCSGPRCVQ